MDPSIVIHVLKVENISKVIWYCWQKIFAYWQFLVWYLDETISCCLEQFVLQRQYFRALDENQALAKRGPRYIGQKTGCPKMSPSARNTPLLDASMLNLIQL